MKVSEMKTMTTDERKEIIELLVKNGFCRSMLLSCDNKQLSSKLRAFREESK